MNQTIILRRLEKITQEGTAMENIRLKQKWNNDGLYFYLGKKPEYKKYLIK